MTPAEAHRKAKEIMGKRSHLFDETDEALIGFAEDLLDFVDETGRYVTWREWAPPKLRRYVDEEL